MFARAASFAEESVDIEALPSLRAENFPYSGPHPWLDQANAPEEIDAKRKRGSLSADEAEKCHHWRENGYIILPKLIEDPILDGVWQAYEKAVAAGVIELKPESAGENDPYQGRFLDPHQRVDEFCHVLRHPRLLQLIR